MTEQLYDIIQNAILNKYNYKGLGYPSIIDEICENNNLIFEIDMNYNGWEVDWSSEIFNEFNKLYCYVRGSMYYGEIEIEFVS